MTRSGGAWHSCRGLSPFPKSAANREFHRKLIQAEGPGVLQWAVDGAMAFLGDGLSMPARLAAATTDYRYESDEVAAA